MDLGSGRPGAAARPDYAVALLVTCFAFAPLVLSSAAIAQIRFQDASVSSALGANGSETYGVAWGDFNADGWPDLFSDNHRNFGRLWRNNGDGTFTDVTVGADISNAFGPTSALNKDTHGSSWADLDNDGDQDLATTVSQQNGHYLISDGTSMLVDMQAQLGLTLNHDNGNRQPIFFDANNDGRLDLKLVGTRETASSMFLQRPDGTFELIEDGLGMACPSGAQWAQLIDVNSNPTLELLCGTGSRFPSRVIDYATGVGNDVSFPLTDGVNDAVVGDFNNDGRQDMVYVLGALRPNEAFLASDRILEARLFQTVAGGNQSRTVTIESAGRLSVNLDESNWNFIINQGAGVQDIYIGAAGLHPSSLLLDLAPGGVSSGIQAPGTRAGMFVGYVDDMWTITTRNGSTYSNGHFVFELSSAITGFDLKPDRENDGPLTPTLLLNTPGSFVDATASSGLTPERCVSGIAADLDNDMDLDLFLACRGGASNISNVVFENLGNATFEKLALHGAEGVTGAAVTQGAGMSESVVSADYNVDGFVDVLISNGLGLVPKGIGGPTQLFSNTGNGNRWLQMDLVGNASNRDAIGAKVYVTAGGVIQYREQNGGYHRWSQNHTRLHFGLAGNDHADVRIEWPSGEVDSYENIAANSVYVANEGQDISTLFESGSGLPPPSEYTCGEPVVNFNVDRGTFLWKDCGGDGRWHLRVSAGSSPDALAYTGSLERTFEQVGFAIEPYDTLNADTPETVVYSLVVWSGHLDGIDFSALPNACFTPENPTNLPVYLGAARTAMTTTSLDLTTGFGCAP